MGFFDWANDMGRALRETIGGGSLGSDYTCSQCIKCKQCIKFLSTGEPMRVFTCPYVGSYDDGAYIDELFSGVTELNKLSQEYIDKFKQNRETIDNYINSNSVIILQEPKPLCTRENKIITTLEGLRANYLPAVCYYFRPYLDYDGVVTEVPNLTKTSYAELDEYRMSELSKEDKLTITQDSEYPY